MVHIIALCGRQGSGKTTIAKHIELRHSYVRLRFADRLKRMLIYGLGVPEEYIDGDMKNEPCPELCGRTGRHAMRTLGTEWGRDMIHSQLWVNTLSRDIEGFQRAGITKFVIDDLRFLGEVDWLHKMKSDTVQVDIIKVERDGVAVSGHQSECEIDAIRYDWIIYNNGSKDRVYESVDHIITVRNAGTVILP